MFPVIWYWSGDPITSSTVYNPADVRCDDTTCILSSYYLWYYHVLGPKGVYAPAVRYWQKWLIFDRTFTCNNLWLDGCRVLHSENPVFGQTYQYLWIATEPALLPRFEPYKVSLPIAMWRLAPRIPAASKPVFPDVTYTCRLGHTVLAVEQCSCVHKPTSCPPPSHPHMAVPTHKHTHARTYTHSHAGFYFKQAWVLLSIVPLALASLAPAPLAPDPLAHSLPVWGYFELAYTSGSLDHPYDLEKYYQ